MVRLKRDKNSQFDVNDHRVNDLIDQTDGMQGSPEQIRNLFY